MWNSAFLFNDSCVKLCIEIVMGVLYQQTLYSATFIYFSYYNSDFNLGRCDTAFFRILFIKINQMSQPGTYPIDEHHRLRQACWKVQPSQSINSSHTQNMKVNEGSDQVLGL